MGKSSPSAPAAPDPYRVASAQTGSNIGTAIANSWLGNANESSPLGSVNYSQTGSHQVNDGQGNMYDVPSFTRNVSLSPAEQTKLQGTQNIQNQMLDVGIGHIQQLQNALGSGFDANKYLSLNPDVAQAGTWSPVKDISQFNAQSYLAANPDVAAWAAGTPDANAAALEHWKTYGTNEQRLGSGLADPLTFADQHWRTFGQKEGRETGFQGPESLLEGLPNATNDIGQYMPNLTEYGLGNLPDLEEYGGPQDFSASRRAVEDALYGRLNPQLERDKSALDVQLTNEGFTRGTEAYNRAMDEFTRQANDARLGVTVAGGQEENRLHGMSLDRIAANNTARQGEYGMRMGALQNDNAIRQAMFGNQQQAATFGNTSRERALQERLLQRQTPLNELSAILSGGQVNMPQFTPYQGGNVAATPLGQYVYQGYDTQSRNYQSAQQAAATQNAGMFGAGANLLGGLFKLSDRRVKRDVERIGELREGIGLYRYRYNWSDEIELGVMADEVEAVMPHAVMRRGGVALVDYGAL